MKKFWQNIKTSLIATILFTVILCGIYPLLVFGLGELFFHNKASGSLIYRENRLIGSKLIGQNFTSAKYFHPRPSHAGKGYDGMDSSGSNLGATSQKLIDQIKSFSEKYREENQLTTPIPIEAVTASGSGLDPHISYEDALNQVSRIAIARGVSEGDLKTLLLKNLEKPVLGIFGSERINVLLLNLNLDE